MSRIPSIVITAGLIGSGMFAWAFAGRPLLSNPDLKPPLNAFGINRSPYGEVFAMAMQGPISTDFQVGMFGKAAENLASKPPGSLILRQPESEAKPAARNLSLTDRLRQTLATMDKVSKQRTNPKPASDAQKFYLRRQAEDKLRFAYQLDPSHYANYNSLHFFLIEGVTTRPTLTPSAAKLAQDTVDYCLKQDNDPRPALTAAAACTNILHLMFADRRSETPRYSAGQMRQCLNLLDQCIARYDTIAAQWDESKNWQLLSSCRVNECEERIHFIRNIRNAADKTILRFANESPNHQVAN